MIQRGHPTCEKERLLVGQVAGYAEAQVLRNRGHRRDDDRRIVDGNLDAATHSRVRAAAIDVIDPQDVSEENSIK